MKNHSVVSVAAAPSHAAWPSYVIFLLMPLRFQVKVKVVLFTMMVKAKKSFLSIAIPLILSFTQSECFIVSPPSSTKISSNNNFIASHTSSYNKHDNTNFLSSNNSLTVNISQRKSYRNTKINAVYRPQDSLVSGIAEIGMGFSLGVLWSELSIIVTGCGPTQFSDFLERLCYQGVIVYAGVALFNRIVLRQDLSNTVGDYYGELMESTLIQVKIAEWSSAISVIGAFAALTVQIVKGNDMSGLSGIDVEMCRAIQNL